MPEIPSVAAGDANAYVQTILILVGVIALLARMLVKVRRERRVSGEKSPYEMLSEIHEWQVPKLNHSNGKLEFPLFPNREEVEELKAIRGEIHRMREEAMTNSDKIISGYNRTKEEAVSEVKAHIDAVVSP